MGLGIKSSDRVCLYIPEAPQCKKKRITIIHRRMLIAFFFFTQDFYFFILHLVRHINNCLSSFLPLVFVFLFYLCRYVLYMYMYIFSACMQTCVCAHVCAYALIGLRLISEIILNGSTTLFIEAGYIQRELQRAFQYG